MKVKFNKFERVAGIFVLTAMISGIVSLAVVAVKQSWFERRINFKTTLVQAEGIFPGTKVKMAGLKVGRVNSVKLQKDGNIVVEFDVLQSYADKIKTDSRIIISRPLFVIGEKIFDIDMGSAEHEVLQANSMIPALDAFDIGELLSPENLTPYIKSFSELAKSMRFLAESFMSEERTRSMVEMFDEMRPLLKNANRAAIDVHVISKQLTHGKNLGIVMKNMARATTEIDKQMASLIKMSKRMPRLVKNTSRVMRNMAKLSKEMNKLIPAIAAVAPELPEASKRAIEAMNEAVIVLKAMQKSFMLKGSVEEVRQAEQERKKLNRKTASEKADSEEESDDEPKEVEIEP